MEKNFTEDGIPWVTPADLSEYTDAYISRGRRDLSEVGYASCASMLMPAGTVLFSSRAPIGYCVVAANEISTNQGFKSLILEGDIEPEFIRYYLLSAKDYAESKASGTTFLELSGKRFGKLAVPVTPLAEQKRIVAKINNLTIRTAHARSALAGIPTLLEKFKSHLLADAYSGKGCFLRAHDSAPLYELEAVCKTLTDGDHQAPPRVDEGIRDVHYDAIYDELPSRICPFCGLGYFRAPGAPRNALDHYMPISKYPFVGADFRNLPPMCSECNSDFKGNKDILFNELGQRQRCIDPYSGPIFSVSLAESVPFAGNIKCAIQLPKWEIRFIGGPQEQAENWDRVFRIRERYQRDVLDVEFRSWLQDFVYWYIGGNHGTNTGDDIAASITEYIETVIQDRLADRAFLKAEVFRLLCSECADAERGDGMKAFLVELLVNTS